MRVQSWVLMVSTLALASCGLSSGKQNHLGLIDAPRGVVVDSKRASDPSPIATVGQRNWNRSSIQKQAEARSIEKDAPYSSLK